jgi:hypothetical protein
MNIKSPPVLDIAYNNMFTKNVNGKDVDYPPDWLSVSPLPAAVICKASEWVEDTSFGSNWQQLGALKVPRGAYHFYRDALGANNYKIFVSTLKKYGGVKNGDVLVLDAEEQGKLSISAMLDFLWGVEQALGNRPIIYSTAALLNALNFKKLNAAQLQYIKTTPVWVAGYPSAPDSFDAPPKVYIPDQTRYGKVVLWQYASEYPSALAGYPNIPGGLDLNWVDPTFMDQWRTLTGVTAPAPVVITEVDVKYSDGTTKTIIHPTSVWVDGMEIK